MTFKLTQQVRQKVPVIQGEVIQRRLNEVEDQLEYLVAYTDEAGEAHERWFLEKEIEDVATTQEAA